MIEGLKEAVDALDESTKEAIRALVNLLEAAEKAAVEKAAVEKAKQEAEKTQRQVEDVLEEMRKCVETLPEFQRMQFCAITLEEQRKAERHERRVAALLAGRKSAARARAYCQGIIRVKARNAAQGRKWEKRSRDSIPLPPLMKKEHAGGTRKAGDYSPASSSSSYL